MSAEEVSRALELATATQERSSSLRQRLASGDLRDVEVLWGPLEAEGRRFLHAIVHDVTERKRVEKIQSALFEISETTSKAQSTEEGYRALHEIVGRLMYARNFYIALRDESGRINFPYFVDEREPAPGIVEPGKGLTDYVMRTGEPLLASPEVFEELAGRGEVENVAAAIDRQRAADALRESGLIESVDPLEQVGSWERFLPAFRMMLGLRDLSEAERDLLVPSASQHMDKTLEASTMMRWLFKDRKASTYLDDFLAAEEERRALAERKD